MHESEWHYSGAIRSSWSLRQVTIGHCESRHPVHDLHADPGFNSLRRQSSRPHRWTEDALVAAERILDSATPAVAGLGIPCAFSESLSRSNFAVTFSRRRRPGRDLCVPLWRYQDPRRTPRAVTVYKTHKHTFPSIGRLQFESDNAHRSIRTGPAQ